MTSTLHLPDGYRENPVASPDAAGESYWTSASASIGVIWQAEVYRTVAAMVDSNDVVIDVGCGTGDKLQKYIVPRG